MTKIENGADCRQGKIGKLFLCTYFDVLDALNEYGSITLQGFHNTLRRYINRKEATKENEVIYNQKWIREKMRITDKIYYKNLKMAYNCGMLDIEKSIEITFYVTIDGEKSELQTKSFLFFSTITGLDIEIKDPKSQLGFPKKSITITRFKSKTSYILNDTPGDEIFKNNNFKLVEFRNYDEDLERFRRGTDKKVRKVRKKDDVDNVDECGQNVDNFVDNQEKEVKKQEKPSLPMEKGGPLPMEKGGPLPMEKVNNNIILDSFNNIILDSNNSNHSFKEQSENELNELNEIKSRCQLKCFGKDEFFIEALVEDLYYTKSITCNKTLLKQPVIRKRLLNLNYDILRTSQIKYKNRQKEHIEKGIEPVKDVMSYYKTVVINTLMGYYGNKDAFTD